MNLQYISDSTGKTTGVFIPIGEWNMLKKKYIDIEEEAISVPAWQEEEVKRRFLHYEKTHEALDVDSALDAIEKEL